MAVSLQWTKTVDTHLSQQWDATLGDVRLSVWTSELDRVDEVAAWGGAWWASAGIPPRRLPSLEAGQQVAEAQAIRLATDVDALRRERDEAITARNEAWREAADLRVALDRVRAQRDAAQSGGGE